MDLSKLGWSTFWSSSDVNEDDVARIFAVHRSHLRAIKRDKELNLHLSGQVTDPPVVGDWVTVTPEFIDEQGEPAAIIKEVLPRKSHLSRYSRVGQQAIVANVDQVVIVTSTNQDLNLNRLQRFLVLVEEGGAKPILVLSKIDLKENFQDSIDSLKSKLNIECIGTSVINDYGIEQLKKKLSPGSTSVFVGSSGVGKSSLVNFLLGEDVQVTSPIREDDDKGRHATRARQMFFIPDGGLIIDTPGVREVSVFASQESINSAFPEINQLTESCRFNNCQHVTEPGCAIQEALESGELEKKTWENYKKILKEAAYNARKTDKVEMANSKKRWKEINQMMRQKRKIDES